MQMLAMHSPLGRAELAQKSICYLLMLHCLHCPKPCLENAKIMASYKWGASYLDYFLVKQFRRSSSLADLCLGPHRGCGLPLAQWFYWPVRQDYNKIHQFSFWHLPEKVLYHVDGEIATCRFVFISTNRVTLWSFPNFTRCSNCVNGSPYGTIYYAMSCSLINVVRSFSFICCTDFAVTLAGGICWTTFLLWNWWRIKGFFWLRMKIMRCR